jgi:hypothetical protein
MAQLQSTNVVGTLCVNGVALGGGKNFKFCCMSGSTTWTPSSDLATGDGVVSSALVGGGGGGGGAFSYAHLITNTNNSSVSSVATGGGGGGGMVYTPTVTIDSTDACTVTVGAGGIGGYMYETGSCVCAQTVCTPLRDPATNGGDTSFGGFTVLGGGAGFNRGCGKCRCFYEGFRSTAACYSPSYDGQRNSGGSSYLGADDITICDASGNASYWNVMTGSGNLYNFTSCGRGVTFDNGETFGAAGNEDIIGGRPSVAGFITGSGTLYPTPAHTPTTVYSINNPTNGCLAGDLGVPMTASQHPPQFFGAGGMGALACSEVSNTGNYQTCIIRATARGSVGNPGIVVLKWYE